MPTVIAGERQIFAKSLGRVYVFENAYERAREIYEQQHVWPAVVSMTLNHLAVLAVQQAKDQAQVHALLEEAWRMEAIHYSMVQRYSGFPLLPCPSMQADSLNVVLVAN